jgi:hypothetical protein
MVRYKMVGRDVNSSPLQYRTWIVNNVPDFDGYYYTGLKSGDTPFVDVVAYQIQDGYVVADFNLPLPLSWKSAKQTLVSETYNSQLAVIDGYVYLFGGENSNHICRATLNNPTDWGDTGFTLPSKLSSSQLAILDGYVYLFGGLDGYTQKETSSIYRASTADPLTWINTGSNLPTPLQKSQLGIADGYIYLYGGKDGYNSNVDGYATNKIFRATTSNPLVWSSVGTTLPDKLFGSTFGLIDGYFCLFGGFTDEQTPTSNIYTAPLNTPTIFSTSSNHLPHPSGYGQFFTIGNDGYLIMASGGSPLTYQSKIFRCSLSNPTVWTEQSFNIPGNVYQSQVAIIYDRIFLFGGNGSSIIFASDQQLKYSLLNSVVIAYGNITRTQYQATSSIPDLIKVIGFPYWKTNYKH